MITIFSAAGCPYAQRTRALLSQLDEPFELREVDLDARDPELLELSPTGRVPFLVDGDVRLFESAVINDYLAEKLGYERAYADDPTLRAQQKLLMRRWDDVIAPELYRSLGSPPDDATKATLRRELAFLATIADRMAVRGAHPFRSPRAFARRQADRVAQGETDELQGHAAVLERMAATVRGEGEPVATGLDARLSIAVIDAVRRSLRDGGRRVDLAGAEPS